MKRRGGQPFDSTDPNPASTQNPDPTQTPSSVSSSWWSGWFGSKKPGLGGRRRKSNKNKNAVKQNK